MDLVIDTSSPQTALAVLESGEILAERVGRRLGVEELPDGVARLAGDVRRVGRVVITTGPGSFTGLRAGASYGIGLAQGLGIPLLGLSTFALVRALSTVPARPVVEAGRGRLYLQTPDGGAGVAAVDVIPDDLPIVGFLSERVVEAAHTAGLALVPESARQRFGRAALSVLDRALPLPYGRVRLSYVTSVGSVRD
ncbi:MAG: tRNA (adenosine(37)-N6)-threonylcarbamoyltransferase complex dimerization subunit type 1 TsaB [Candidatus Dormibacteraeota bacterium]|nr:tRNA (adenosine(37)-N6)-threonylcarbamoyltransferase complex dimerization subunit type 1 TsaB [Candidatus Dormibacteraeota bacterium]